MSKNEKILQKAIEIASLRKEEKMRFCSIITDKRNFILAIGFNSYTKTHPKQKFYSNKTGCEQKIFLHSEIDALIKLPYGSKPYSIYIARVNNKNKPVLAKPCKICEKALKDFNIKNIYWTT